jgi:two-component system response regulator YesN
MDYRIEETLISIENNLAQPFTIQNLAKSTNLSVSHFQHLFKQEIGKNFTQYIKDLRLQKAKEFLETSHLNMKEIRAKIGVTDETHFLRDFRQKFGKTPSHYRKFFRDSKNG